MTPPIAVAVTRQDTSVDEFVASRRNFVAGAVTFAAAAGTAEAALAQAPQNLRFQNPPGLPPPRGYSQVVEVTGPGRTVYIAGQIGLDASGKVADGFRAQATQVFENLKIALAAVGAGFDHVVKLNGYMTDIPTQLPILRSMDTRHDLRAASAHCGRQRQYDTGTNRDNVCRLLKISTRGLNAQRDLACHPDPRFSSPSVKQVPPVALPDPGLCPRLASFKQPLLAWPAPPA
jgi:enamine deaminase RidA (YjgF/YER057c/UK114 family)